MGAHGKIDWDSTEAWQKLVSAIIATGVKVQLKEFNMNHAQLPTSSL